LFNAADIVVVGRFAGDLSLAAVGSTSSLVNLLTNLFVGLSVGANVLAARDRGAKDDEALSRTVHTAMLLSLISGIVLTVAGIVCARSMLTWMQTPAEVLDLAVLYLRIYFTGMTATMIYNFGSAVLRSVGDTKRPLYFLFFAGVINVILNLFFVIVLKMDVAGVATATVISQCISAFLVVGCLVTEASAIRLRPAKLKIHKDKLGEILKIGLPAGIQGVLFSLSNVIIQSSVNTFGAIIVAGNSAASNIEGFIYVSMNAFYQATISFTSQNMGAKQYKKIVPILMRGQLCVVAVGLVFGNAAVLFGRSLLGIYTLSDVVVEAGMVRLKLIAGTYALCGIMDVMVGALRGVGKSVLPMIVTLVGVCGVRIAWLATVFRIAQYHTVQVIYFSYPLSWTVTLLAHIVCFAVVMHRILKKPDAGLPDNLYKTS
jgi:putative MATE family efflux protein